MLPIISTALLGLEVPIPNRKLVESQNKLELKTNGVEPEPTGIKP